MMVAEWHMLVIWPKGRCAKTSSKFVLPESQNLELKRGAERRSQGTRAICPIG